MCQTAAANVGQVRATLVSMLPLTPSGESLAAHPSLMQARQPRHAGRAAQRFNLWSRATDLRQPEFLQHVSRGWAGLGGGLYKDGQLCAWTCPAYLQTAPAMHVLSPHQAVQPVDRVPQRADLPAAALRGAQQSVSSAMGGCVCTSGSLPSRLLACHQPVDCMNASCPPLCPCRDAEGELAELRSMGLRLPAVDVHCPPLTCKWGELTYPAFRSSMAAECCVDYA